MLGTSPHAFKVNFCKYTNETRIVDRGQLGRSPGLTCDRRAQRHGVGRRLRARARVRRDRPHRRRQRAPSASPRSRCSACCRAPAGSRASSTSGRSGATSPTCSARRPKGFRARDAMKHGFIDESFPRSKWDEGVRTLRARASPTRRRRRSGGPGVPFPPLEIAPAEVRLGPTGYVTLVVDRRPRGDARARAPRQTADRRALATATWSLRAFRELDDALLRLRFNHLEVGLVLVETKGDPSRVLAHEAGTSRARRVRLVRPGSAALPGPRAAPARQHGEEPLRDRRPGSCFVGIALRARARVPIASTCSPTTRAENAIALDRRERRALPDGERQVAARQPLPRRAGARRARRSLAGADRRRRRPTTLGLVHASRRTRSTGTTRCASRSKSA